MKPLLIVDARSYTAAFANRAKGGGFEFQGISLAFFSNLSYFQMSLELLRRF